MKRYTGKEYMQQGVSVVELLVVLAISAILVAFSIAQFGNATDIFETQNAARELKVNLERARFDSVKRRPSAAADMANVTVNNGTTVAVALDLDQNGTIETSDTRNIDFSLASYSKIIHETAAFPITVAFDRRGHVIAEDSLGNTVDPVFVVCNNCTADNIASSDAYVVAVSDTGTVSMYNYGETQPGLTDPTVTTITGSGDIDPMLTVEAGATPPAGTPAPTPTPDPTPTITPTPLPTATPEPTPTPVICAFHERPSISGCVCVAPMRVFHNGQCR